MPFPTRAIEIPGEWKTIGAFAAVGTSCVLVWTYRKYIPPFGRIPRRQEPPTVFGSLLGGVTRSLEHNQQEFLERCQEEYGNIFTLRAPVGDANDVYGDASGLCSFAARFLKAMRTGFTYQTVILDPYCVNSVFRSNLVDRIPCSRQAIARFNLPKLLETEEGVRSLGSHLRKGQSGMGYEALIFMANSLCQTQVEKTFPAISDEMTPGEDLQQAAGGMVLPTFMDLFFGEGFATEEAQELFRVYEPRVLFRTIGLDGRVPTDEVEEALLKLLSLEMQQGREQVSHLVQGLEELKTDFGVPEEEVCRAKLAVLWGANVNSQNVTTWTVLHIMNQPEIRQKIEDKIARCLRDRTSDWKKAIRSNEIAITKADLDKIPYLSSVLWEVARRYGKANVLRAVARDGMITVAQPRHLSHAEEPFRVRQGDWISTFPQLFHRDPRYFVKPLVFDPLRFIDPSRESKVTMEHLSTTCKTKQSDRRTSALLLEKGENLMSKGVVRMKESLSTFMLPFGLGGGACPASGMAFDLVKVLVIHILATVELKIEGSLPVAEEGGVHAVPPPVTAVSYRYKRCADDEGKEDPCDASDETTLENEEDEQKKHPAEMLDRIARRASTFQHE